MKNNKGFSMVELLAAVTILGILAVIGIGAVSRIISKAHEEYYKNQEKNLILAAQSYTQSNKSKLPKIVGKKTKITVKTLKEANYLKSDLTSYNGKTKCSETDTYVNVFKYGLSDYSYTAYVTCEPDKSASELVKTESPVLDVTFPGSTEDLATSKVVINIKGNDDSTIKLLSYTYVIYYYDNTNSKYVQLTSSGNVESRNFEISKTINLNKYTLHGSKKIKVIVSATNINGNSKSGAFVNDYQDETAPDCVIDDADKPNTTTGVKPWVNTSRTITVGCNDNNGSGCEKDTYTKTFTRDNIVDYITISDLDGNKRNCYVTTYIDKTKPKIKALAYKCKSGTKIADTSKKVGETTISSDTTWTSNSFKDVVNNWLNKANYPDGVCFVFEVSDNLALESKTWSWNKENQAKNAAGYKTLNGSGSPSVAKDFTKNVYKVADYTTKLIYNHYLIAEGHRYAELNVKDAFGNQLTLKLDVKIDRTKPTKPTINGYKKNNKTDISSKGNLGGYNSSSWLSGYVFTQCSASTDAVSGLNYYLMSANGATSSANRVKQSYRNVNAEGKSNVSYIAVDEAGNESDTTTFKVWLDRTKPTITLSAKAGSWSNGSCASNSTVYATNTWKNHGCVNVTSVIADSTQNSSDVSGVSSRKRSTTGLTSNESNASITATSTKAKRVEGTSVFSYSATDAAGNTQTASYTIKLDRTSPTCSISKSNTWTTGGVSLSTSCSDDRSGVSSCNGFRSGITSSQTHSVSDYAGNNGSCSVSVYSQRQESHRTRSWNNCLTGSPNQCVGGNKKDCYKGEEVVGTKNCEGIEGPDAWYDHNLGCCRYIYDSCATTENTCQGGWNSWSGWSGWSNTSSCSGGQYNGGAGERSCRTLYY